MKNIPIICAIAVLASISIFSIGYALGRTNAPEPKYADEHTCPEPRWPNDHKCLSASKEDVNAVMIKWSNAVIESMPRNAECEVKAGDLIINGLAEYQRDPQTGKSVLRLRSADEIIQAAYHRPAKSLLNATPAPIPKQLPEDERGLIRKGAGGIGGLLKRLW